MAWKDINTQQITNYYPSKGTIIHVPDDPVYLSQNHTGVPDPFLLGQRLGTDPHFHRFLKWCFILVGVGLCLLAVCGGLWLGWERLMKADMDASRGKPVIWSASSLKWSSRLFHSSSEPVELGGPDAIVTGNIDGMKLDAFSNLTMQGDVANSSLTAYSTITVGNVTDSTLKAHKIVIKGKAVNVKRIILRPHEGIPFSKYPR